MKIKLNAIAKCLIVLSLVIVVAGMFLLGFLGFNQTVRYKDSYEISVSAKNVLTEDAENMKKATDEYFADKGVTIKEQIVYNEGEKVVYKFDFDVSQYASEVQAIAQAVLPSGIIAEVQANQTKVYAQSQLVDIIIAGAIVLVLGFVYLFFMENLASSLTAIINAVFAMIIYLSTIAIARIPANPFFAPMLLATAIISTLVSVVLVNRFNAKLKNNTQKLDNSQIAFGVVKSSLLRFGFILGAILLPTLAALIFVPSYFKYLALHVICAGVVSVVFSALYTPILWSVLKKNKVRAKEIPQE